MAEFLKPKYFFLPIHTLLSYTVTFIINMRIMALLSFGEFIFLEEALVVSMYCKFGMQSQLLGAFP